jgi:hypothetical protein
LFLIKSQIALFLAASQRFAIRKSDGRFGDQNVLFPLFSPLFACCYPAVFAAVILLFSGRHGVKNVSVCSGLAPLAATFFGA